MDPTYASGTLEYTTADPTDGAEVVIGGTTYTLVSTLTVPAVAGEVEIEAGNPQATIQNLVDAIQAAGADVEARQDAVNRVAYFTAALPGATGNALPFSTTEATFTLTPSGGTLAGGSDGSVVAYSLLSLAEAKTALRVKGDSADAEITALLRAVTEAIEEELGYRPVTAADPITEYHDLANAQGYIYLRTRPATSITSVTLADGTVLAASDYRLSSKEGLLSLANAPVTPVVGSGLLKRTSSPFTDWPEDAWARGLGKFFKPGTDSATVVYVGGYTETSVVPGPIKAVAEEMLARRYRTRERKSQGVTSEIAQGLSTATKYDPKAMTEDMKSRLRPFKTLTTTARR